MERKANLKKKEHECADRKMSVEKERKKSTVACPLKAN